jgi:hypothetical protein
MKQFVLYLAVVIFSIFIGSQITESVLLVPYWKSLSASDFYTYYAQHGPVIGRFYTVLTIIAALIPISVAVYCKRINSRGLKFALVSSFFAILFIASFYVYFKGTNELFYEAHFTEAALKKELIVWNYWHWGRIVLEFTSLVFLMLALIKIQTNSVSKN